MTQPANIDSPCVLIVEDSAVEAELLRRILVRSNYQVIQARNGEEGLRVLAEQTVDLVLTDIRMPVMNGYEFCRAIKQSSEFANLPVVMLSALADPGDIIEAIDAGADSYLTKPYAEIMLLKRIVSLLQSAPQIIADQKQLAQINYNDKAYSLYTSHRQILNLLLSLYENIIEQNRELIHTQTQLNLLNESLEKKVLERTEALRHSEERFRRLASFDPLTNLANRRILTDRIQQVMSASKRSQRYAALMFIDLDKFKQINDDHGHNIGDQLLIEVAHRLTSCVREIDTVARLGGDEFVVMLNELDSDQHKSSQLASIVGEKIRNALSLPYVFAAQQDEQVTESATIHCTSSIGVMLFVGNNTSPDGLLKHADQAMYRVKSMGGNAICFYEIDA